MPAEPRVRRRRFWLECEIHSDPIWWAPDLAGWLDELPLKDGTGRALRKWADCYETLMGTDFDWPDPRSKRRFRDTGRRLWAQVQDELGDDWEVGYYDVELERVVWPDDRHDDAQEGT